MAPITAGTYQPTESRRAARVLRAHPLLTVFLVALVIRAAVAVTVFLLKGGVLFADDQTYFFMARGVVTGHTQTWDESTHALYRGTAGFSYPLTAILFVVRSILAGQLYVALLGSAVAALVARLTLESFGRVLALASGLAVALLPSQVLFSALTLKDATVWALLAGLAVGIAVLGRSAGRTMAALIGATAALLFLLSTVRAHTFVAACWAVALCGWIGSREGRATRGAGLFAVAALVPLLVGQGPLGLRLVTDHGSLEQRREANAANAATAFVPAREAAEKLRLDKVRARAASAAASAESTAGREEARAQELDEQALRLRREATQAEAAAQLEAEADAARLSAARARDEAARAGAAAAAAAAAETSITSRETAPALAQFDAGFAGESAAAQNLRGLPRGLRAFLLEPLPWRTVTNARVRFAQLETLLWYPIILLALVGLARLRRESRVLLFPVLILGSVSLIYGLTEGNFGTAYRHRGEVVWAAVVLAAAGAQVIRDRRTARRGSTTNLHE